MVGLAGRAAGRRARGSGTAPDGEADALSHVALTRTKALRLGARRPRGPRRGLGMTWSPSEGRRGTEGLPAERQGPRPCRQGPRPSPRPGRRPDAAPTASTRSRLGAACAATALMPMPCCCFCFRPRQAPTRSGTCAMWPGLGEGVVGVAGVAAERRAAHRRQPAAPSRTGTDTRYRCCWRRALRRRSRR